MRRNLLSSQLHSNNMKFSANIILSGLTGDQYPGSSINKLNPWPMEYSWAVFLDSFNYWFQGAIIYRNEIREFLLHLGTWLFPSGKAS